jgi:hypothetical protein
MVLEMLKKEILLKISPLIETTQLEGKMLMPV